jgi:hypothetical protein
MQGRLKKMSHNIDNDNLVHYQLCLIDGDINSIKLNDYLGKQLRLEFLGKILCINCGAQTKNSFSQGYCYRCFNKLAECDICILKPELCHFAEGTCRDEEFANKHCNTTHSVYLAITSDLKVGITRQHQESQRWVDQGAIKATRLISSKTRHHAGLIESRLAQNIADKTNWRNLLKNNYPEIDLIDTKKQILKNIADLLKELKIDYIEEADSPLKELRYPVLTYPQKINSHNLDKEPVLEGTLLGIKGQYLIFDNKVINLRKYTGYLVEVN